MYPQQLNKLNSYQIFGLVLICGQDLQKVAQYGHTGSDLQLCLNLTINFYVRLLLFWEIALLTIDTRTVDVKFLYAL